MKQPTPNEVDKLCQGLRRLVWKETPPKTTARENALLALIAQPDYEAHRDELRAFADSSTAYRWLQQHPAYRKMQETLLRRAKKSAAFARPLADYELLLCVAEALASYIPHIEGGTRPPTLRKADLHAALKALSLLQTLEAQGLRLSNAVAPIFKSGPGSIMPTNMLEQMHAGVTTALAKFRKPQPDERTTDRFAAKRFTVLLLATFNEAPKTMIERFGELIDYQSDALRKHADRWIAAYRTRSVL